MERPVFNVYPAEVERILAAHPGVAETAVVGVPDEHLGEAPVAFVVPHAAEVLSGSVFLAWAATLIANFKVPRRVVLVDALPRTASMKVLKNQLRDLAQSSG